MCFSTYKCEISKINNFYNLNNILKYNYKYITYVQLLEYVCIFIYIYIYIAVANNSVEVIVISAHNCIDMGHIIFIQPKAVQWIEFD